MAKKVKATEVSKRISRPQLRVALQTAGVASFIAILAYGVASSRRYADANGLTPPVPLKVVFVDPPKWMNEQLRERLERVATPVTSRSSLDGSVVQDVASVLSAEPWVKNVRQVRRVYGQSAGDTLQIECEFRAPVALVQDDAWFWMVDAEGIKLPERFMKNELAKVANGHGLLGMQLRVITGVHERAPQAGEKWQGEDLAGALELAKLFHDKPYMNDVAMIDVAGVDPPGIVEGRRRNEVVLVTKFNTQIRWGEPMSRSAFSVDVPVGQKLLTLERLYKEYGRVDAGRPWIEIRYDSVLYPTDAATESATTNTP
jgi:hypothetical protein